MLDVEGINAMIRHQRQEIETLEGTKSHLSEKVAQLKGFLPQKATFEDSLKRLPAAKEERNAILNQLKEIATHRLDENNLDVSANYCLYLLTSLASIERTNEELEETYIQTKFGDDLVNPTSSISYNIPADMDRITERYSTLKAELALAESHLDTAKKANESMRRELDDARKRYEKMSSSIPSLARQAQDDITQVENALRIKEEQQRNTSERLASRQLRSTQRTALINDFIHQLDPSNLNLPNTRHSTMLSSLRSLLMAVNDTQSGTDVTMMSHARALVHTATSITRHPLTPEKPRPAPPPPRVPLTPTNPQRRTPLTPQDLAERAREVKAKLAMLSPHL